jgi:hypothetical protein
MAVRPAEFQRFGLLLGSGSGACVRALPGRTAFVGITLEGTMSWRHVVALAHSIRLD